MYFDELEASAETKAAALRVVSAVTGVKIPTMRNWIRAVETANRNDHAATEAEKDAELTRLRKENARLKEANEILKLASAFFAQAELDRTLK
ncbi:hypothetical protein [Corynebacterium uterequi]|uniref:Transposase n=1 Tax=Corynebacterium uterequi TaxID=1072256 RepID=A0A0G3HGA2_9CORY|nr:hypothetical protein [Corynebacterium uterequi]AKK11775.1 hypothetical protein CUTER_08990 [Corynebacterium uterequi]